MILYLGLALSNAPVANIAYSGEPYSGLRFGGENSAVAFSGTNAGTTANGSPVLGSINARAVQLNPPNIPASGDFAYVFIFQTAPVGASASRTEVLLGVDGATATGGAGGSLQFKSTSITTGSTSGATVDATNAGKISVRRQHSSGWQLWPQGVLGADLSGIALEPDTTYVGMIAVIGTTPRITFVNVATGVVQTVDGGTAISGTRPTAPLFNLFGALGSGADRQGFGGAGLGMMVYHGAVPTNVQLQGLASGTYTAATLATAAGATLEYHNTMDYSQVSGSTIPSAVGSNATIISGATGFEAVTGFIAGGKPRFYRLGKYYVFPAAIGATTGKVWFEGYVNAGEQVACWVRYVGGGASTQVRVTADGSGYFIASATIPISTPFYRSFVSVSDPTRVCHEFDVMTVDLKTPVSGQSECELQFTAAWTSSSDFTPVVAQTGFAQTSALGTEAGPWAAVTDILSVTTTAFRPRKSKGGKSRPRRIIGRGWPIGDGGYATLSRILTDHSRSIELINCARSGHSLDNFIFDKVTFSQALTLSGSGSGPYTATITLTDAAARNAFSSTLSAGDLAAMVVNGAFRNQVRPGTFSLDLGGGVVITDTKTNDGAGTLSGTGVSSGTITYVAGTTTGAATISITFTGTPASTTGTLTWQPKQETQEAASSNKTANLDGYGVREALDDICTNSLRYGFSCGIIWWSTANISDGGGGAAMRASMAAKYELMRNLLMSYILPSVTGDVADPPMMVCAKGRDTGNTGSLIDNARLFADDLWNSARTWVRRGGHYYDNRLDVSTSPHQTYNDDSGPRIGRRMGAYLSGIIGGSQIREPQFRAGAATRTSNTVLTVPLTYIGSGLNLTVASGGNANALSEWYQGGVVIANDATTIARIASGGQAVELVKLSGTWATGAEDNVTYLAGAPGSGTTPPVSLLYDDRGGFGGSEPGLPVAPKLS